MISESLWFSQLKSQSDQCLNSPKTSKPGQTRRPDRIGKLSLPAIFLSAHIPYETQLEMLSALLELTNVGCVLTLVLRLIGDLKQNDLRSTAA